MMHLRTKGNRAYCGCAVTLNKLTSAISAADCPECLRERYHVYCRRYRSTRAAMRFEDWVQSHRDR